MGFEVHGELRAHLRLVRSKRWDAGAANRHGGRLPLHRWLAIASIRVVQHVHRRRPVFVLVAIRLVGQPAGQMQC
jgi:hypothetical protein